MNSSESGQEFTGPVGPLVTSSKVLHRPSIAARLLDQLLRYTGRKNRVCDLSCTNASSEMGSVLTVRSSVIDMTPANTYQQSATRKLAFGSTVIDAAEEEKKKHLSDFYNNSTLTCVAKLFSVCVLLAALFMLMRETFGWDWI